MKVQIHHFRLQSLVELINTVSKGQFFSANGIDLDGEGFGMGVQGEHQLNNVGSGCERCGHSDHERNNGVCPALQGSCYNCKGVGHYANKCPQTSGRPVRTPAQRKHGEKVMHQRENVNRPINAIKEEQEIGAIGDSSDDDDETIQEEELIAALKKVRLRKKKMSPKREPSKFYTDVIKLSAYKINALSALPLRTSKLDQSNQNSL